MNAFVESIIRSRKPIYCAAPLFSPIDRIAAANMAGILESTIRKHRDNTADLAGCVFLPFRDTDQSALSGQDRAKRIYQLDIQKLRGASALLARADGLAKDSGVAMEIGFAFGCGIPIAVLVTSFMGEGFVDGQAEWFIDPIVAQMADHCSYQSDTPEVTRSYYQSHMIHEWEGVRNFVEAALAAFSATSDKELPTRSHVNHPVVYLDIMGERYEWALHERRRIQDACMRTGLEVMFSRRYSRPAADVAMSATADIASAMSSSVGVFSGDAPELDPGSAALFGLCKAIGIPTVFQYSSCVAYRGAGGQQMKVNLMIEQAADIITVSTEETIDAIKHLVRGQI